ncbi:hypothetical protein SDC9_101244 [bioreactor metagenome]|uniref:Uncharacterized protein n=1 Tax=bioreactor metagenome TaxID=1076179 RepID=A0A645ANH2_9ZZZZ
MVFVDDFADFGRHAVARKIRLRVLEVRYDEARAFFRRKGVVDVAAVLIFLKVERAAQFAHVVVHGSRPRKQRVCANGFRRAFRQRRRHHAVVVGAGRCGHHLFEQRVVCVGQLVQARGSNDIEHVFPYAQHADAEHGENQ